jgi:integrase/recombinase XerD
MKVSEAVNEFLEHRRQRRVSKHTIRAYRSLLGTWLSWRAEQHLGAHLADIEIAELRAFMLHLQERVPHRENPHRPPSAQVGWSGGGQASMWRVLRALWRWLDAEELLTPRQQRFFAAQRLPRPKEDRRIREIYSDEQIDALLQACESDNLQKQHRDRAIILLLLESGMRVSELCSLDFERIDTKKRQARIAGKGGAERWVFWGPGANAELLYHILHSQRRAGALFLQLGERSHHQPLTPDAVRSLVKRLASRAGVSLPARPVHAFRHTFARRALQKIDGFYLQQLLGHSTPSTTARYVRENPEVLRRIHQRLFESESASSGAGGGVDALDT